MKGRKKKRELEITIYILLKLYYNYLRKRKKIKGDEFVTKNVSHLQFVISLSNK